MCGTGCTPASCLPPSGPACTTEDKVDTGSELLTSFVDREFCRLDALPSHERAPTPACEAARLLTVERLCSGRKQNQHLDTITRLVLPSFPFVDQLPVLQAA